MDDQRLKELIGELAEAIRGEAPCSHITTGHPGRMVFLSANRSGLLSLAKHLLSAALSPPSVETSRTPPVEIDGHHQAILVADHDFVIGFIQHEAEMPVPEQIAHDRENLKRDWTGLVGCALITLVVGGLLITGITTWVRFLLGAA